MGRSASLSIVLTSLDSGKQQSIWQLCDGLRCKVTVNLFSTRLLQNVLQGRRCSRVNPAEDVRVVSKQAAALLAAFLLTRKRGAEITFWMCLKLSNIFPKEEKFAPVLSTVTLHPLTFSLGLSSCPYMTTVNMSWHLCEYWLWRTLTIVLLWKLPKVCGVVLILVVDNVPVRLVGLDALRRQQEQLSSL